VWRFRWGPRASAGLTLLAALARVAAADSAAPLGPVHADELSGFGYLRVGYEARPSATSQGGPGLAVGGRFELGSLGLDLSVLNLNADGEAPGEGFSGGLFRILGLWMVSPARTESAYVGAGAELIGAKGAVGSDHRLYRGEGSHTVAVVGYELRRTRRFRVFGQLEGLVPLYALTSEGQRDPRLHLYMMLSLGLGAGATPSP
jgi:hypothetical protein